MWIFSPGLVTTRQSHPFRHVPSDDDDDGEEEEDYVDDDD